MQEPQDVSVERIERLQAELEDSAQQVRLLQEELDETNRGVVALYAELDTQAEELRVASQRSESKFLTIYAEAPSGIALIDDEGIVLDANPAMLRLLARKFDEVIGHSLSGFAPAEWAFRIDAFSQRAGSAEQRQEMPIARPDGALVHVEWSVSPQIESGVTMVVASDISARVELERQRVQWLERERVARGEAEQISRMKDDFIAVLSHELRTPLNAMMGWTHVLRKRGGTDEAMRGLAAIERNGTTQARMIADLLDMSRLNLGKLPIVFAAIEPGEEVTNAVKALRPSFEEKKVDVQVVLEEPLQSIRADASRLQQVIWNLTSNAIKFTPAGGRVVVTVAARRRGLIIQVTDSGQGIAADFLPFVFDRFAQSDAASNRHRGGLGLGLAIVKQLVEAHGGEVTVHSDGLGLGTTFEVWLPIAADAPAAETGEDSELAKLDEMPSADMPLQGLEVLVVDDHPDASALLQIILGDRGANVRVANSVDAALRELDAQPADLLVSDIGMPGRDGYELAREIRRREATAATPVHMPAIALTSFNRAQDQEQARQAGFDAHCAKPLKPLKLLQKIQALLGQADAREAR